MGAGILKIKEKTNLSRPTEAKQTGPTKEMLQRETRLTNKKMNTLLTTSALEKYWQFQV